MNPAASRSSVSSVLKADGNISLQPAPFFSARSEYHRHKTNVFLLQAITK
jgi:hypothetical protein